MKKLRNFFYLAKFNPIKYIRSNQSSVAVNNLSNLSNVENQWNATERKIPNERNQMVLPRKGPFDCNSIAFDNRIAIIQPRSIAFDWFDCDFRSIAFD